MPWLLAGGYSRSDGAPRYWHGSSHSLGLSCDHDHVYKHTYNSPDAKTSHITHIVTKFFTQLLRIK